MNSAMEQLLINSQVVDALLRRATVEGLDADQTDRLQLFNTHSIVLGTQDDDDGAYGICDATGKEGWLTAVLCATRRF